MNVIIEVQGEANTGKSLIAEELQRHLNWLGFNVSLDDSVEVRPHIASTCREKLINLRKKINITIREKQLRKEPA